MTDENNIGTESLPTVEENTAEFHGTFTEADIAVDTDESTDAAAAEANVTPAEEDIAEDTTDEPLERYDDAPPAGELLAKFKLIYDEDDILDVMNINSRAKKSLRIMTIAMIALPFIGIGFSAYSMIKGTGSSLNLVLWIAVLLFFFYSLCVAPRRNARRSFMGIDEDQKAGKLTDFSIYESGIYTESEFGTQAFEWSEFKEIIECPAGIVVITQGRGPVFFADRNLQGVDRERLSRILLDNFGNRYIVCNYTSVRGAKK